MAELANCARCEAVFVKSLREICRDCYLEEEEAYQTVYHFLRDRKNREAKITEIVEATGVEEELIIKFVKEKRLTPRDFPMLAYPCDRCGRDINEGKICASCTEELQKDLAQFEEEERKTQELRERQNIYFTMNQHKK